MVNNLGTTLGRSPSDPGLEKPAKVLVADDEEAVRELIVAILDDGSDTSCLSPGTAKRP